MNTYFAIVHKEPDSSFGITFPDLPGCFSAADTEDDLLVQAQLALTLYASDLEALPKSRPVSELLEDPDIKADAAEGAFFIAIPLIRAGRKARYNLMLDTDLVAGIDRTAQAVGMNRSEYVSEAVAARLGEQVGAVVSGRVGRKIGRSLAEVTGKKMASAASKILHNPKASKAAKSVAASALTQKVKKKK